MYQYEDNGGNDYITHFTHTFARYKMGVKEPGSGRERGKGIAPYEKNKIEY